MKSKGFTLTELIIAIAIVAVMSAIAVPSISSISRKASLSADATTSEAIENSIYEWMSTGYNEDTFYRNNLYNLVTGAPIANAQIGGKTEQMYSYEFAGTNQLPGIELTDEHEIRHSAITAIKATSSIEIIIENNEQFIKGPKTASDYGFKYYYKIGKVNAEKVDSPDSPFGNDEVYRYFIWLDQIGGNIDTNTTPKRLKDNENYVSLGETMYSFSINYGGRDLSELKIEIIEKGKQSYTFDAVLNTPAIFSPGIYDFRLYSKGDLVAELNDVNFTGSNAVINY